MTESKPKGDDGLIKCKVCLKEIPKSEAKSTETQEYVMYFCGLDCYEKWSKQNDMESGKKA